MSLGLLRYQTLISIMLCINEVRGFSKPVLESNSKQNFKKTIIHHNYIRL